MVVMGKRSMEAKPGARAGWTKFFSLKYGLLAVAALLLVTGAIAAFYSPVGAWPLCIAGIALVVVAHFDQISEISASATGAKVVLKQVEDRVVELKQLVALSSRMHLVLGQRLGHWDGGFSEDEKATILRETEDLMKQAGLSDEEIKLVRVDAWDRSVHLDYVSWAIKHARASHRDPLREEWSNLQQLAKPGTPDEVEAALKRHDKWTSEAEKVVDRYRYYVQYRRHLDPVAWADRNEPLPSAEPSPQ